MENHRNNNFDYSLILLLILFFLVSCIAIYNAQIIGELTENFLVKQIIWYIIGGFIIIGVMYFDMEQIQKLRWYIYSFSILLLVFLIIAPESIAREINGAKSWFTLPGISFQSSEITKISLIISLSYIIKKSSHANASIKDDLSLLVKMTITTMIPIILIMQQPDLGTSLVLISIYCGLVFISGISWKIITPVFLSISIIGGALIYLIIYQPDIISSFGIKKYQLGRIYAWLDPETYRQGEGYHLYQSLLGIGSGQLHGITDNPVHIPESHTDFIFSVIANRFGFYGAAIVISLYFLLIYRIVKLSLDIKDQYSSYICIGVITMITFHAFQNIGMTIGLLPITGIPLPLISYGGSSMIGNMLALGLVLSISFRNKIYMFD
ncbi:FtsW/RodA/SpoVE family cell cycle protein [Metabacillus niabensis]|uniref:FtsW/RodA/SpoVE family cell cycle protein n=1 Tax=Metabacillus niabensis TaxID=324854 RepID=UPI001CFB0540|nr:FtsW/RodA/SpoVE family cell cycle protein [Metabacillus niabensis]